MPDFAVVFDMDGVIVNSNPFHKRAWKAFCDAEGLDVDDATLEREVYGRVNADCLPVLFGPGLSDEKMEKLSREKESLFRRLAKGNMPALPGLEAFLEALEQEGVKRAVATSAPRGNVVFTMEETGLGRYFPVIVDESMIARGKPAPDIYLAAAKALGVDPQCCVAFEDSLSGAASARTAGMTVVGLATTHAPAELADLTELVINDFTEFSPGALAGLRRT